MTAMRTAVFLFIFCQMLIGQNSGPERRTEDKAVMQFENDWADAVSRRDLTKPDKIIADDWTGRYPFYVLTKTQELELIRSGEIKVESVTTSDLKMRFLGDVAVVTGTEQGQRMVLQGQGRKRALSLGWMPW